MGVPKISLDPMNVEEFFLFTDGRPDDEKWELIDGQPVMNSAASQLHQIILLNLGSALLAKFRRAGSPLIVSPGIGVRVSPTQLPIPDLIVRPREGLARRDCSDAIAVFEILSPSTARIDMRWKRKAYAGVASIHHYVVAAQDTCEIVVFDRIADFAERRVAGRNAVLDLPACKARIALADIYRETGLD